MAIGVFSMVGEFAAIYRRWNCAIFRESFCCILTIAITSLILLAIGQFSSYTTELAPISLVYWTFMTAPIMIIGRIVMRWIQRWMVRNKLNVRNCAIVGINELGLQLAENISNSSELNFNLHGFYDDRPADRTIEIPENYRPRIGEVSNLVDDAQAGKVTTIFITLPMRAEARINQWLEQLADTTASVYIVPDVFVFKLLHSRMTDIHGLPVISLFENPLMGVDGIVKRVLDIFLSLLALSIFGIPMLIVAALVKLTSKGPVIFKQLRYGLDGKEILVWKFRSMTVCENGDTVKQATKNDSRLTPIGAFIRKTSIDELPQLINVLQGRMSMVGPRPHASAHNEDYRGLISGYMLRHKIKPGITGLAQVRGYRGETDTLEKMEKRVQSDHQYIREWSVWLDLKILFLTVFAVLKPQNAY